MDLDSLKGYIMSISNLGKVIWLGLGALKNVLVVILVFNIPLKEAPLGETSGNL